MRSQVRNTLPYPSRIRVYIFIMYIRQHYTLNNSRISFGIAYKLALVPKTKNVSF